MASTYSYRVTNTTAIPLHVGRGPIGLNQTAVVEITLAQAKTLKAKGWTVQLETPNKDQNTDGGVDSVLAPIDIGPNHVFKVENLSRVLRSSGNNALVPNNASVPFGIGSILTLVTLATGCTITAQSALPGGTPILYNVNDPTPKSSVTIPARSFVSLTKVDTNTWYVMGAGVV